RGDEERGLVEHWLAQGVSRGRYIGLRIVAFAALAMAASTLAVGAAGVGAAIVNDGVPAGALALQGVALVGLVLCCYAVALLAAMKSEVSSSTGSRRVCRAAATSACGSSPSPRSRWPPPHSRWAPRASALRS